MRAVPLHDEAPQEPAAAHALQAPGAVRGVEPEPPRGARAALQTTLLHPAADRGAQAAARGAGPAQRHSE